MQDDNYPEPSSSSSHVGSSNGGSNTHATARTRAYRSRSPPLITQHGSWSSQHDLLDQLTSSVFGSSCYLPYSMAEPTLSSEMESSNNHNDEELSSSLGANVSSETTPPSGATNVPVSSPSLRKILHPTNIETVQKTPKSSEQNGSGSTSAKSPPPEPEYLAEYTCPICFLPPTNATLTPCGHICCGSCLFTAVKTIAQRGAFMRPESSAARCPVCRADIPGWDGKGGGVIGLKPRAVISL